jgi:hypothetical protein
MATFMARKDALFQSIGRFSPGLADTGQFLQVSEFLLHTGKIYLQGLSFETFNLVPAVFFWFPPWFMDFIGRLLRFWKSLSKHSMNSNDWWILVPPPSSPMHFIDTTGARARQSFELPCRPSLPCERLSHPHWHIGLGWKWGTSKSTGWAWLNTIVTHSPYTKRPKGAKILGACPMFNRTPGEFAEITHDHPRFLRWAWVKTYYQF